MGSRSLSASGWMSVWQPSWLRQKWPQHTLTSCDYNSILFIFSILLNIFLLSPELICNYGQNNEKIECTKIIFMEHVIAWKMPVAR